MMKLSKEDLELIKKAKSLVGEKRVSGGSVKEVGAALITKNGKVFTGANLSLSCGVGFCAEHSAIADMISHSDETMIKTIVAYADKVLYPCGRCRELMQQVNVKNREYTNVIISKTKKVKLKELLPGNWMEGLK